MLSARAEQLLQVETHLVIIVLKLAFMSPARIRMLTTYQILIMMLSSLSFVCEEVSLPTSSWLHEQRRSPPRQAQSISEEGEATHRLTAESISRIERPRANRSRWMSMSESSISSREASPLPSRSNTAKACKR